MKDCTVSYFLEPNKPPPFFFLFSTILVSYAVPPKLSTLETALITDRDIASLTPILVVHLACSLIALAIVLRYLFLSSASQVNFC